MTGHVSQENAAPGIVRLTLAQGPSNALGADMRAALDDALAASLSAPGTRAVLIAAEGPAFSIGLTPADHDAAPPGVPLGAICARIDAAAVPVVALLGGRAMGGGCELALACHYRVALAEAELGLPDIAIGLPPGAGTTQRLPRLTDIETALEMLLTGGSVDAARARASGLVDAVVEDDLAGAGLRFAQALVAEAAGPRPAPGRALPAFGTLHAAVAARRAELGETGPVEAPARILDCVDAAAMLPFETGLAFEAAAYEDCRDSAAFRALRHVATAEAGARQRAGGWEGAARPVAGVGLWGDGPGAAALAATLLTAGATVRMAAPDEASLARGLSRVEGLLAAAGADAAARARLSGAAGASGLSRAEVVIEAGAGPWAERQRAFAALASAAEGRAVLAGTGALATPAALAAAGRRPADTLWLHLPELVPGARLAELVRSRDTAPDALATLGRLMDGMLRVCVVATGESPVLGLLIGALEAADAMVEQGASPYAVDGAMRDWGFRLGPYEIADRLGLETLLALRARLAAGDDPQARPILVAGQMVAEGRRGRADGRGYYIYSEGAARPDPEIGALLDSAREVLGRTPRDLGAEEIADRVLAGMAQAGAGLVRRGVVARAEDLDLAMVHGAGLARWRGGPMRAADERGLLWLRRTLRAMAEAPGGSEIWAPDPLIAERIKEGRGLTDPDPEAPDARPAVSPA